MEDCLKDMQHLHPSNYSKISSPFKPHSVLNPPHLPTTLSVFINDDASGLQRGLMKFVGACIVGLL